VANTLNNQASRDVERGAFLIGGFFNVVYGIARSDSVFHKYGCDACGPDSCLNIGNRAWGPAYEDRDREIREDFQDGRAPGQGQDHQGLQRISEFDHVAGPVYLSGSRQPLRRRVCHDDLVGLGIHAYP
jgi:hypothetical protein